ncbi:MAG: AAA family ATPase, partial [Rhodococcus sp.]|nr:AAA family ATPase [Rhodococcus sp. (in: high G+C Gram-positive bacteria)]
LYDPPEDDFSAYPRVLVALDNDDPGETGSSALLLRHRGSVRIYPPDGAVDWCESGATEIGDVPESVGLRTVYSVAEIASTDFGTEEENNWFANGIIPVGGEIVVHGKMKSLKSVIVMEMARAITTATPFAGYVPFLRPQGAGRVLLFQFEIPPWQFQQRLVGMRRVMGGAEWEAFSENLSVFGVGDKKLPRLKISDPSYRAIILRAIEESKCDVVIFDPIQKMTGGADLAKAHEIDPLLDTFNMLQSGGLTVIYSHHNNKAERDVRDAYGMSGSQRFGADADSICSVYHDAKNMIDDHNPGGIKQRNLVWELRNGICAGRSITATPDLTDPDFMHVEYGEPLYGAPVVTSTTSGTVPPSLM